ncbi:MAG: hypothetical protein ACREDL_22800 [Bradyrhizobium sp.]
MRSIWQRARHAPRRLLDNQAQIVLDRFGIFLRRDAPVEAEYRPVGGAPVLR